jgi:hypothetical protein
VGVILSQSCLNFELTFVKWLVKVGGGILKANRETYQLPSQITNLHQKKYEIGNYKMIIGTLSELVLH